MNDFFITPATLIEGEDTVVSFGSGDSGGRSQARARGRGGRTSASPRQVSALRSQINRAAVTRAQRRALLNALDLQAHPRSGRTSNTNLASISTELRDLLGR